jgi:hypothetical protein
VTLAENFGKGYAPHFVVSVDGKGEVLGVSVRGVKIDAGHTRDFGPQVLVVPTVQGKQPDLNRPVVLSPEGRKVQPEQEKSFLQKYTPYPGLLAWRLFANERSSQVLVGACHRGCSGNDGRRRREIVQFILFSTFGLVSFYCCDDVVREAEFVLALLASAPCIPPMFLLVLTHRSRAIVKVLSKRDSQTGWPYAGRLGRVSYRLPALPKATVSRVSCLGITFGLLG